MPQGEVYSYGRCDEFEMEESALLQRLFGLPARVAIVDAPPEDGVYSVARTNRIALRDFHEARPFAASGAKRVAAAFLQFLRATERPAIYCRLK